MHIQQHLRILASADRVWEVIGHQFTDIDAWASAIPRSEPDGDGGGRTCVAAFPGVEQIRERLTAYDDADRTLAYVAESGMPAYVVTATNLWRVTPRGHDNCQVSISVQIELTRAARPAWPLIRLGFSRLGRRSLGELKHYVEQGVPSPRKQGQLAAQAMSANRPTPQQTGDAGRFLAMAMSFNALFSAGSGLTLLGGGSALGSAFGIDAWLLRGIGGGLVLFAGALLWLLAEPRRLELGARVVVAADAIWIAGALLVLTAFPSALTSPGRVALAAVTVVVAVLMIDQVLGLRRIGPGPVNATSPLAMQSQRIIDAPVDQVWQAVTDAGDYARFASGIAATEIVSGAGQDMVRVCTDDRGGQWEEHCTLWIDGHSYRMSVDVDTYPPYYRVLLHELAQTWSVEPHARGTRLILTFTGAVKLGILGRLAARILGNPRRLAAILEAYDHDLTGRRPAAG